MKFLKRDSWRGFIRKRNKNEIENLKKKNINLLPPDIVRSRSKRKAGILAGIALMVAAGISTGAYIGVEREIARLEKVNEGFSDRISGLEQVKRQQDYLEVITREVEEKRSVLMEIEKNSMPFTVFFSILEDNIPKDVGFINCSSDEKGSITINGRASSEVSVAELIYNMKKEKRFSGVFVSNISAQGEGGSRVYSFSLVCEFGEEK